MTMRFITNHNDLSTIHDYEFVKYPRFFEGGSGEGSSGEGENGSDPTPPPTPQGDPNKKTFTQQELNNILKREKEKYRGELETLQTQLSNHKGTEEERNKLMSDIDTLRQQYQTKEQNLVQTHTQKVQTLEKDLKTARDEAEQYKKQFEQTMINNSLTSAGAKNDVHDVDQIIELFGPKTSLVNQIDKESNKPTGKLVPMTKVMLPDANGQLQEFLMTPEEALEKMKKVPKYQNLYKSNVVGGHGLDRGERADMKTIARDPQAYRQQRAEERKNRGNMPNSR